MVERVWREGNPPILLLGNQISTTTMENSMEIPLKTKNIATICSSNLTPGHISGGNHNLKRYMHPNVHRTTIYNSQDMKQPQCPLADEWLKVWYIYIQQNTTQSQK